MPEHPLAIALLVIVVMLAIVAGLWFGRALGSGELSEKLSKSLSWSNIGKKVRAAMTRALIKLYRRSRED